MPLLTRMVPAPLSVDIRHGAVADLGSLLADRRISSGGEVAVAVGPGLGEQVVELIRPGLGDAEVFTVRGGTVDAARELGASLRSGHYDAVVGIGGGKTLDVTKYAASVYGIPMVSVATSLANDGIASPTASLDHDGGKGSYGVHMPIAVIVDLDFVRRAPVRQLRAGIGDTLSNLSAIADWQLAAKHRGETVDGLSVTFARMAGESVLYRTDSLDSDAFLTALAEALVLGGLASAAAGSTRATSGADHEISHALDHLYPDTALHGEQVAFGALFASFLRESDEETSVLAECLLRHGLPRTPADLGITEQQFVAAVAYAPRTRPDRYTILEHLDLSEAELKDRLQAYLRFLRS